MASSMLVLASVVICVAANTITTTSITTTTTDWSWNTTSHMHSIGSTQAANGRLLIAVSGGAPPDPHYALVDAATGKKLWRDTLPGVDLGGSYVVALSRGDVATTRAAIVACGTPRSNRTCLLALLSQPLVSAGARLLVPLPLTAQASGPRPTVTFSADGTRLVATYCVNDVQNCLANIDLYRIAADGTSIALLARSTVVNFNGDLVLHPSGRFMAYSGVSSFFLVHADTMQIIQQIPIQSHFPACLGFESNVYVAFVTYAGRSGSYSMTVYASTTAGGLLVPVWNATGPFHGAPSTFGCRIANDTLVAAWYARDTPDVVTQIYRVPSGQVLYTAPSVAHRFNSIGGNIQASRNGNYAVLADAGCGVFLTYQADHTAAWKTRTLLAEVSWCGFESVLLTEDGHVVAFQTVPEAAHPEWCVGGTLYSWS